MTASGWPVLMLVLVLAVMVRRKASRCRKCPVADDQPGRGDIGGDAVGGVQELAGQLGDADGSGVHGDASRERAAARARLARVTGGLLSGHERDPGAAGRSIGGQHGVRQPNSGLSRPGKLRCQALPWSW
jgi:hypothetical protein